MNNIGEIVGGVICGLAVLMTLGFIIWFLLGPMAESMDDE